VPKLNNETIKKIKKKKNFNELVFKITQYGQRNCKPPENLIKTAEELGRQIDIPEEELRNIRPSTL